MVWSAKNLPVKLITRHWDEEGSPLNPFQNASSDEQLEGLQHYLVRVCNASMPKRTTFKGREAIHWWNGEIVELKATVI